MRNGTLAGIVGLGILVLAITPRPAQAYSVLTHEAIIDSLWTGSIRPILKKRFPQATDDDVLKAHAYAYGGCIIQDLGYYPFGNHLFTNLAHYVRSADFVRALLENAHDIDEYAFALGAAAHFGSDVYGHSIAVNRSVPILYPKLRRKFGDDVTYEDNPAAHLKTEFGLDVLQVARGYYAPQAYHDFIGFEVSKDLLDRAFQQTYGLELKDVFHALDMALGTYRFSVSKAIPEATKAAWALKKEEIQQERPTMNRKQFLFNIDRASYRKKWGDQYQTPGIFARTLAFLMRLIPKVGPFSGFGYQLPTPQTEKMFEDSFDAAVRENRKAYTEIAAGNLDLKNLDLDTGDPVSPGKYRLTDQTYDQLLRKLAANKFNGVSPALRENILAFYARMKKPDPHGIQTQLAELKGLKAD